MVGAGDEQCSGVHLLVDGWIVLGVFVIMSKAVTDVRVESLFAWSSGFISLVERPRGGIAGSHGHETLGFCLSF